MYLAGDDPLHGWAFERRRRLQVGDTAIWVAPVEYVILRKLEYFRASGSERHLRDVAMMLRISSELVDHGALMEWAVRRGVEDVLARARAYDPPER